MGILNLETRLKINKDLITAPNLIDRIKEADRQTIAESVFLGYEHDKASRFKWEKRMNSGMDLAMQIQKDKNFPWPNSSNVVFPLVTIAALQFSAQSYGNIIQGSDVVKYRIVGTDQGGELRKRADRISEHMSWQVLEEDTAWETQHDLLLINLAIVGTAFIKTYYSAALGHNVSELVPARDLILNYWSKSVDTAPRKTQIIPLSRNEIYEKSKSQVFADVLNESWFNTIPSLPEADPKHDNRKGVTAQQPDEDTPFISLEQHRLLDLDGDGYAEPYICTIDRESKCLLRVVSRIEREEDIEHVGDRFASPILRIKPTEAYTKYSFIPAADGGIYDTGFGSLIGPLNESVNSGINQLLDAGTMANSNGGFLGRGAKIRGGAYTFAPWVWKRVDSTGDDLRKSMIQMPVREPSDVMFKLIGLLIQYSDRVAGTVDQNVGVTPGQNTPAETSRNTMEAGMRVYTAIFKRVWRSMKEEFKKLHGLNAVYLERRKTYGVKDAFILQEDYKSNPDLVVPVADPNITSAGMRFAQAAAVRQAAHEVPGYDVPAVEKFYLKALKVENIDELYKGPDKVPPLPNPKMQLAEMKLKEKEMDIEYKKNAFIGQLMEDRKVNQAKIALMQAQALAIVADTQLDQQQQKIDAFETMIDTLKKHNEMIDARIKTLNELQGDSSESSGKSSDGRGVPRLAGPTGNPGASPPAPGMAAGANGAMGS